MATNKVVNLKVVSFNMHGFNQGAPVIEDLISSEKPDVFMLQEHWLTPDNLCRFERYNDYFCFGQSAILQLACSPACCVVVRLAALCA